MLHPVRLLPASLLVAILVGGVVLMLPAARVEDSAPVVMPALFTSVSAVSLTGLATVDTGAHWTPFGQAVILALVQLGGLGIMTLATLLTLLVGGRLGLRTQLIAQAETHTLNLGDVGTVLRRVAVIMLTCELVVTIVVAARFRIAYEDELGAALWEGLFYAVGSFNNAGFALHGGGPAAYVGDPWVMLPLCLAVILGGIGFPVIVEVLRTGPRRWTVHTRITVYGSALLLLVGTLAFAALEWRNPGTIGPLALGEKVVAAITGGVMPRSGGASGIDYGSATQETQAITIGLMFIGGGSAGTSGGIKVTTFFLLAFVMWAEVRGEREVTAWHRSISDRTQRQALSVALLGVAGCAVGTLALLVLTEFALNEVMFEAVSAFATVGLSTGLTPELSTTPQLLLMVLMFVGRVGPITVASALALKSRPRLFRLPEERPIVG